LKLVYINQLLICVSVALFFATDTQMFYYVVSERKLRKIGSIGLSGLSDDLLTA